MWGTSETRNRNNTLHNRSNTTETAHNTKSFYTHPLPFRSIADVRILPKALMFASNMPFSSFPLEGICPVCTRHYTTVSVITSNVYELFLAYVYCHGVTGCQADYFVYEPVPAAEEEPAISEDPHEKPVPEAQPELRPWLPPKVYVNCLQDDDLDDPDHQPEPLEPGLQPFRYKLEPDDPFRYQ